MKFNTIFALAFLPALSLAADTVTFDNTYDNASGLITSVACSASFPGITTFGKLPNFPNIGGAPAVTGFNSPGCRTCWKLTFVNAQGVSNSINVLAIDVATTSFNIAQQAMDKLTGGQAVALGRAPVTATQLAASSCGL